MMGSFLIVLPSYNMHALLTILTSGLLVLPWISCQQMMSPTNIANTTMQGIQINIQQGKTTVDTMTVKWYVKKANLTEITQYQVHYDVDNENDVLPTDLLPSSISQFTIKGLQASTSYNVCVSAWYFTMDEHFSGSYYNASHQEFVDTECKQLMTIPIIRLDSIVALIMTVSVIVLIILAGCLHWKRRKFEHDMKRRTEDGVSEGQAKDISQRLDHRYSGYEQAPVASIEVNTKV